MRIDRLQDIRCGKHRFIRRHGLCRPIGINFGYEILVFFGKLLKLVVHAGNVGDRRDLVGHHDIRRRDERAPLPVKGERLVLPGIVVIPFCQRKRVVVCGDAPGRGDHRERDRFTVHPTITPVVFGGVKFAEVEYIGVRLRKFARVLGCIIDSSHGDCF